MKKLGRINMGSTSTTDCLLPPQINWDTAQNPRTPGVTSAFVAALSRHPRLRAAVQDAAATGRHRSCHGFPWRFARIPRAWFIWRLGTPPSPGYKEGTPKGAPIFLGGGRKSAYFDTYPFVVPLSLPWREGSRESSSW